MNEIPDSLAFLAHFDIALSVSSHTLQETAYKPMMDSFKSQFVPIEEAADPVSGNYSYHAVKFDTGEYGYLHSSGWTSERFILAQEYCMRCLNKGGVKVR